MFENAGCCDLVDLPNEKSTIHTTWGICFGEKHSTVTVVFLRSLSQDDVLVGGIIPKWPHLPVFIFNSYTGLPKFMGRKSVKLNR